ncbi:MAG: ABC transporter substrate-binding protein [Acetobacteraceae bacterium]
MDRAVFRFMPESGARNAAMQTGEAQINGTTDGPTVKSLQGDANLKVLKVLPFHLQVGKFNHAQPPCDDVNFRRAVAACLNMEETMAIAFPDIYDMSGGWAFKNSPYASQAGQDLYNIANQAKAKALLAKSGYKGKTLTFIVATGHGHGHRHQGAAWPDRHQGGREGLGLADRLEDRLHA